MADPRALLDLIGDWGHVCGLPPFHSWVLQADPSAVAEWAWPGDLPGTILTSTRQGDHAALMLGPDEWLLIGGIDAIDPPASTLVSLVDVSARDLAFEIAGRAATAILNAGCPLDLADRAFPAGMATRTVFGKAEVVLWRPGLESLWRMVLPRSMAPYVAGYLSQAVLDL